MDINNLLCDLLESYVVDKNATYQYIATELTLFIKKSENPDCIDEKQNEVDMLASMHILTEYALQIYNDLIELYKQSYALIQDYPESYYFSTSKFLTILKLVYEHENCTYNSKVVHNEHTFDEHMFDSERSEMESPNFEPDKECSEHSENTEKTSEEHGVSNFEMIKTMSPQEFAAFLFDISDNCSALYTCGAASCFECPLFTTKKCNYDGILKWLNEDCVSKHSSLFAWIRNFHRDREEKYKLRQQMLNSMYGMCATDILRDEYDYDSERSERSETNESEDVD